MHFTDSHPVTSRQHQSTPVDSGSNPPRRAAEPETDTQARKFHFHMIVRMEAANMVLQAMAKLFTEQLHTSCYPPVQAPRSQSICPAVPFLNPNYVEQEILDRVSGNYNLRRNNEITHIIISLHSSSSLLSMCPAWISSASFLSCL